MSNFWKNCSTCKKEIAFGQPYYVCSVSSCNSGKNRYRFCSISCFDSHAPVMKHRDAGAIRETAPNEARYMAELEEQERNRPKYISKAAESDPKSEPSETDVLVVASKVKKYIKDRADMNTSASSFWELTKAVTTLCDAAIESARNDGRKTVMDRDFPKLNL